MAIIVTENWSAYRRSLRPPWSVEREFMVSGTSDSMAALTAVDPVSGLAVPQRDDPLTAGSVLKCMGPEIKSRPGLECWIIGCQYALPPSGEWGQNEPDNPLNAPIRIGWQTMEMELPVDADLDGRPYLQPNGEVITGATRRVTFKRLTVVRNEPYLNPALWAALENTVNQAAMTVAGIQVAAQHMRCNTIQPASDYEGTPAYIPNRYEFDVIFDDSMGPRPFQDRRMLYGSFGWWNDGGTKRQARFSDGSGNLLDSAVRLDESGIPYPAALYGHVRVGANNETPTAPPAAVSYDLVEVNAAATAKFGYFKRVRLADFTLFGF